MILHLPGKCKQIRFMKLSKTTKFYPFAQNLYQYFPFVSFSFSDIYFRFPSCYIIVLDILLQEAEK